MNKVNLFPTPITPSPLIFLSNLFEIEEVALVGNLNKTSLRKKQQGVAMLFCLNHCHIT